MIYFRLDIKNIFKKKDSNFREKNWYHKLPYERSIEIDYGEINDTLLTTELDTSFSGRDHAGPEIELSIFGYGARIMIPKSRHWNYRKNCWLDNYKNWMSETETNFIIDARVDGYEFNESDFVDFYEDGDSPKEAINNFYFQNLNSQNLSKE